MAEPQLDERPRGESVTIKTDPTPQRITQSHQYRRLALVIFVLMLCYSKPLYDLVRFSLKSDLYSHIVLIPFVSGYLIWARRNTVATVPSGENGRVKGLNASVKYAAIPTLFGVLALVTYQLGLILAWPMKQTDHLALTVFSFVCFVIGACFLFLNKTALRSMIFALAFLVFMVPFPSRLEDWIETFFQHTSAEAAYAMLRLSGMPVFQDGVRFKLPGVWIVVAPQCSGIHSSLVLFITSFLAGYLLLRSPWKRAALTLAVIPLAILRNGLRVFTIAQLCVRISPDMLNSWIHHHGGPVFFLLSLIPFFLLLLLLRRSESDIKA
jgi:exosortase C (VPDSG-CTERM-specific)